MALRVFKSRNIYHIFIIDKHLVVVVIGVVLGVLGTVMGLAMS